MRKLYVDSGHAFEIIQCETDTKMFSLKCKIEASYMVKRIHSQVVLMIDPLCARVNHGTCESCVCKTPSGSLFSCCCTIGCFIKLFE